MGSELGVDDMLGRGELIFDLVEIVRETTGFFVLENVKKFYTRNKSGLCRLIKNELESIGRVMKFQHGY